jgi:hypothetical protein
MEKAKETIGQLSEHLLKRYSELKPKIRSTIENHDELGGYVHYIMGLLDSIRSDPELLEMVKRFADIDISPYKT